MTQINTKAKSNKILAILSSPWTLLLAMALGVFISQCVKPLLPLMEFIATIYMRLLQMCALPIVISAVAVNIGLLIKSGSRATLVKWLALCVTMLLMFTSLAAASSALCSEALRPSKETSTELAELSGTSSTDIEQYVNYIQYGGDHSMKEKKAYSMADFLTTLFPANIFASMTSGDMLPTIFFFIALGVMLTFLKAEQSGPLYRAFDGIYAAMNKLMGYILVSFPLAMMALLAQQFSAANVFSLIGSLVPLVLLVIGITIGICLITFLIIQIFTKCTLSEHLRAIKRTFFVAVGTSNSLATVSVALEDVCEHLHVNPQLAKSVLPISISMCQPGVAASVAVAAVYGMVIYEIPFTINTILLTVFCSVIFSLAVIGVPGLVAVSMLTIVLNPLYIPSALIITIYLTIIPIINPPVVFASVYTNFGIISILNREERRI